MKLDNVSYNTSPDSLILDEKLFSIGDSAFIMDILRSKMYSNPIESICREISCNSRDSHRESGKADLPIEISIPSYDDLYIKFKDFGVGISPDRIENVYIKYGVSTKRDDNVQCGAFGFGAKVPLSYTDSFNIITNYNGTKYNYLCFVDESKIGKLSLISSFATDESNGTEIIIPVKSSDISYFKSGVIQATKHWTIKPIIKNAILDYKPNVVLFNGDDWKITRENSYNHRCKIIIDGIEYPLDIYYFSKNGMNFIQSIKGEIYLYFNNGDLSLSSSREQIYFDENTIDKIKNKFKKLKDELFAFVVNQVNKFDNLWDASVYFKGLSIYFDNNSDFYWNNIKLTNINFNVRNNVYTFFNKNGDIKRNRGTVINFINDSLLFINDLNVKEPTYSHVKKIFTAIPDLKSIQVICAEESDITNLNKIINLDKLVYGSLSSFNVKRNKITKEISRCTLFKFSDLLNQFSKTTFSSLTEDSKVKVLCTLNDKEVYYKNLFVRKEIIKHLLSNDENVSFYGVDELNLVKINEKHSKFISFEDYISAFFKKCNVDFTLLKYSMNVHYGHMNLNPDSYSSKIKNSDSLFLKKINSIKNIDNILKNKWLLELYERKSGAIDLTNFNINNYPDYDIENISINADKKYPLLSIINSYFFDKNIDSIVDYINMVDSL